MYGHGKCVADIGGRYLGNLSYGAQRPSLLSRYNPTRRMPEEKEEESKEEEYITEEEWCEAEAFQAQLKYE